MIKCPSCGHKNKDNTKFCPECGFKSAASKNSSSLPSEFSVASSGAAIESEHGNVIKYEGDCIMASFGISESNELDPSYSCYA
ncbi:MAG TPA: zinc-ribbon domain-containing protein, partial [Candidatus Wallbacteria bacterium]|nr:zinc-ribbon domain-containing protein [Candidatus Wallbacteria bacterium]